MRAGVCSGRNDRPAVLVLRRQHGQQLAEFALLIGIGALVAVSMQLVTRHAISQGIQSATERVLGGVVLRASPSLIEVGQTSTISWNIPGGGTCTIPSGGPAGWAGSRSGTKEQTVTPTRTTTYRLDCGGVGHAVTVRIGTLDAHSTFDSTVNGDAGVHPHTNVTQRSSGSSVNEDDKLHIPH